MAGALPTTVVFATLVLGGQLPDLGPFHVFLQAAGLVVAGIGAYLLEASTRAAFLQRRVIARQAEAIEREKDISERLLRNMLPEAIAHRLRSGEARIADGLAQVSVLFADLVGSTVLMAGLTPAAAVELLDELFSRFDGLAERHGLEKVKTVGDGYMAAAGAPLPVDDHAARAVAMGLEMIVACADLAAERQQPLSLRVGIHSGPVVAGVIGRAKYSYDLWGDTVNTAARMESSGLAGCIQVTDETCRLLAGRYPFERRDGVEVKGKGVMSTWTLDPATLKVGIGT
jgi:class 3 adenylate cyclase